MKIYNRRDFVYGLIMCCAVPARVVIAVQDMRDGEVGSFLWVLALIGIAARYLFNACNESAYDMEQPEVRRRMQARQERFGRWDAAAEGIGPVIAALSVLCGFALPEVSLLLLLAAILCIFGYEQLITTKIREILRKERGEF